MTRKEKREFFDACTYSQSCPIIDIWFQNTNSTEREATIREFVPGLYLSFEGSSFDSYLFDDFIYETATRSTKDCEPNDELGSFCKGFGFAK